MAGRASNATPSPREAANSPGPAATIRALVARVASTSAATATHAPAPPDRLSSASGVRSGGFDGGAQPAALACAPVSEGWWARLFQPDGEPAHPRSEAYHDRHLHDAGGRERGDDALDHRPLLRGQQRPEPAYLRPGALGGPRRELGRRTRSGQRLRQNLSEPAGPLRRPRAGRRAGRRLSFTRGARDRPGRRAHQCAWIGPDKLGAA